MKDWRHGRLEPALHIALAGRQAPAGRRHARDQAPGGPRSPWRRLVAPTGGRL